MITNGLVGDSKNIVMKNNTIVMDAEFEFEADSGGDAELKAKAKAAIREEKEELVLATFTA